MQKQPTTMPFLLKMWSILAIVAAGGSCDSSAQTDAGGAWKPVPSLAGADRDTTVSHAVKLSAELVDLRTRTQGIDWPAFLGPQANSQSPEEGIAVPWPAAGPPIVWQCRLGAGYGSASVSQGRLFVFDALEDRARLRCLKSETGEPLWKFEYRVQYQDYYGYDTGPRACPVIDEDRVYIHGVAGMLHCLRAADGKLLWRADTHKTFGVQQNFFGTGSAPVVEQDLLLLQVGGSPPGTPPIHSERVVGNATGVVAFDKRTGEIKYSLSDELASYSSPVLADVDGRRWCFVFARGGLLGFNPQSGKADFHFPWRATVLESVNAMNPVVVRDRVFISETYGPGSAVIKVRPGGYDVLWTDKDRGRRKAMKTHWNTPIYHDGYLYGCSGREPQDADLRCIELETGKVMWAVTEATFNGREERLDRSSLLYVDGHFVCLTEYGVLLLFRANPEKFDFVSGVVYEDQESAVVGFPPPRMLQYPAWAAPVLSHGLLYVRGKDRLLCLELTPVAAAP